MNVRTVQDLSSIARGRRQELGISQLAVAEQAGVSRAWLVDFEAGKVTVEIGRVLGVLQILGLTVDVRDGRAPFPCTDGASSESDDDLDVLIEAYARGEE